MTIYRVGYNSIFMSEKIDKKFPKCCSDADVKNVIEKDKDGLWYIWNLEYNESAYNVELRFCPWCGKAIEY